MWWLSVRSEKRGNFSSDNKWIFKNDRIGRNHITNGLQSDKISDEISWNNMKLQIWITDLLIIITLFSVGESIVVSFPIASHYGPIVFSQECCVKTKLITIPANCRLVTMYCSTTVWRETCSRSAADRTQNSSQPASRDSSTFAGESVHERKWVRKRVRQS